MASNDKTGDKLIASMRKSKSGKVTQKNSKSRTKAAATADTSAPAKNKVGDKIKQRKKTASTSNAGIAKTVSFSHGRRVWPD